MNKYLMHMLDAITNGGTYRIVFLGDSLTSNEWVHPNWREIVEYVLKRELIQPAGNWKIPSWGLRFYNAGFDGSSTVDWTVKLDSEVLALKPDLVVIMGTVIDVFYQIPPVESAQNISQIISKLAENGVGNIVYMTDTASADQATHAAYQPYADAAAQLFPRQSTYFIDLHKLYSAYDLRLFYTFKNDDGTPDNLHPNRLGQAYTAKLFLRQFLAIEFNPERYLEDLNNDVKYPNYQP